MRLRMILALLPILYFCDIFNGGLRGYTGHTGYTGPKGYAGYTGNIQDQQDIYVQDIIREIYIQDIPDMPDIPDTRAISDILGIRGKLDIMDLTELRVRRVLKRHQTRDGRTSRRIRRPAGRRTRYAYVPDGTTESRTGGWFSKKKTTDGTSPKTRALRALGEFRRRAAGPRKRGKEGRGTDPPERRKGGVNRRPARHANPHVRGTRTFTPWALLGPAARRRFLVGLVLRLFPE